MKKILLFISIISVIILSKNYLVTKLVLTDEKNHIWSYNNGEKLDFLSYLKGETIMSARRLRSIYDNLTIYKKETYPRDTLRFFIDKKTYPEWLNFQDLNLKISNYKSQVYHKERFKAFYVDKSRDTSKVQFRNVGMNMDHYQNFDGITSFKVKFSGTNNSYGRKSKKNILRSVTRPNGIDYLSSIMFNKLGGGISIESKPIYLKVNNNISDNHIIEDVFDKYLIEKNRRREGSIIEVSFNGPFDLGVKEDFFHDYNHKSTDTLFVNKFIKKINKGIVDIELIDTELFDLFILLCNDFFGAHPAKNVNLHWYHNPLSNLMEPTIREVMIDDVENVIDEPLIKKYIKDSKLNFGKLRDKYYTKRNISNLRDEISKHKHIDSKISNSILKKMESYFLEDKLITKKSVSKKRDTIIWDSKINLKNNFTLDKNSILILKNGAEILIYNSVIVKINGQILCQNTTDIPFIGAENSSIFINTKENLQLKNLTFKGFSNLRDESNNHYLPSAITFYKTSATLDNCKFRDNYRGDDFVNFFKCPDVNVINCSFENILADAIDSDFSNICIENTIFNNIGNDAVDCSASNLRIYNSKFNDVKDKCVSAGESTIAYVYESSFSNSAIALVSKDGSNLTNYNSFFENNNLDITGFRKKLEYTNAQIYSSKSNNLLNLIEYGVKTNIDSEKVKNVKDDMYGKKYGKATEK